MAEQHASADDLLHYAEGSLASDLQEVLESHLDHCDECCLEVMLHREVRDLEALGVLPTPGSAEPAPGRTDSRGIAGLFAGAVTGLGLLRPFSHSPHPALASDFNAHADHDTGEMRDSGHHTYPSHSGNIISHDDVRNLPFASSDESESHHGERGEEI